MPIPSIFYRIYSMVKNPTIYKGDNHAEENLQKLAKLAVRIGVNIQKDRTWSSIPPIECNAFARALAEEAYKAGARDVSINYSDEKFSKIRYTYADLDVFKEVPTGSWPSRTPWSKKAQP